MYKNPSMLGNGHVFFAGIINDVIMSLPLGTSALSYLIVSFVASYISKVTVNTSLFTDWFTFVPAIFFSNLSYLVLIANFSELTYTYNNIFYNSFFTFLFYPVFWLIFNIYKSILNIKNE
jgi:cell shape-determining protein MreD